MRRRPIAALADGRVLHATISEPGPDTGIAECVECDHGPGGFVRVRLQDRDGTLDSIRGEITDEAEPIPWLDRVSRDQALRALDALARVGLVRRGDRAQIAKWIRRAAYFDADAIACFVLHKASGDPKVAPLESRYIGGIAIWPLLGGEHVRVGQIAEGADWLDAGAGRMPFGSAFERDVWVGALRAEGFHREAAIASRLPYVGSVAPVAA